MMDLSSRRKAVACYLKKKNKTQKPINSSLFVLVDSFLNPLIKERKKNEEAALAAPLAQKCNQVPSIVSPKGGPSVEKMQSLKMIWLLCAS